MSEKNPWRARGILLVLHFLSLLPLPLVHLIGAAGGLLLAIAPNKQRRISLLNIALCYPHKSRRWQLRLMRKSLMETGKTLAELGPLWFWEKARIEKMVCEVHGQEHVNAALAGGCGMIIASPHIGSWELSGLYMCSRFPITILFKPSRIAELDTLIVNARERFGAKIVPINAGGIKAVIAALGKGEAIGILPDQEPKAGKGTFAPLFGVPAYTPLLLSRLGRQRRAPIVFVVMQRRSWGRGFRFDYLKADDDVYSQDPDTAAHAINRHVEQCINMAPTQYMWTYKRFRTCPDGSIRDYRQTPVR